MAILNADETAQVGAAFDIVAKDVNGHGLGLYKLLAKEQPDLYKKHFGHLADDASMTKQGANVVKYVNDIVNCIKGGDDACAVAKINSLVDSHLKRNISADEYKKVVDTLVHYLGNTLGDKKTAAVDKLFQTAFLDAVKGELAKH
jgi:hemoglobin-like flavoprotein